ncbi:putative gnat family [Diplodia seriata]|uniref:Putative gnat family n=1 Tax=Diplodia seriata TaxID=420778 RepID=A0A0G2G8W3_9PEZI|nr:putative gnat family [Diplodia seriata]
MANAFRSARLLYRAVEDQDEDFILAVESDPSISGNANADLLRPASKRSIKGLVHFMQEIALLGVVICLQPCPAQPESSAPEVDTAGSVASKNRCRSSANSRNATPIGYISLSHELGPSNPHHRNAAIGVSIAAAFQSQGYGSEAINWILDWAFDVAGLHRVSITSFAYNEGAGRLYQRLGFSLEGRRREALWFRGGFHDMLLFSMLRHEWEKRSNGV